MPGHAPRISGKVVGLAALVFAALASSAVGGAHLLAGNDGGKASLRPTRSPSSATSQRPDAIRTEPAGIPAPDLDAEVARLRAAPAPRATEAVTGRISGEARTQPDLYAAQFVQRLLTQDYRASREQFLAWVQAESAQTADPLVVGLIPEALRPKWAVFSVSDTAEGPSPVPSSTEWNQLANAGAHTTVLINRVTEPLAWSNAVEGGRITDPGLTARVVSAQVTLHTSSRTDAFSVELSIELEGPPARADWGFVGAVTYTSIPIGTR